jgi:hypothetical protein
LQISLVLNPTIDEDTVVGTNQRTHDTHTKDREMRELNQLNAAGQRADVNLSSCEKWYEGTVITPLTQKARDWFEESVARGAASITIESGVGISLEWFEKLQNAGLTIAVGTREDLRN